MTTRASTRARTVIPQVSRGRNTTRWSFAMCAALLSVLAFIAFSALEDLERSNRQVARSYELISQLRLVSQTLQQAETGQRGYLLTADSRYLEPYIEALSALTQESSRLRALVQNDPEKLVVLAEFESYAAAKVAEMRQGLSLVRAGQRDVALGLVDAGYGRELSRRLRELTDDMLARETVELRRREVASSRSFRRGLLSTLASVIAAIGLMAVVFHLLQRGIVARHAQAKQLAEQTELFRVTFASLSDGVITTDRRGFVTNLNDVACDLTGWRPEQALGRPIEEVLALRNETTGQAVDSPARLAMEGGKATPPRPGLLDRKGGGQLPVEESASPIRDADLRLIGTVLVFRDITVRRHAERELARRLRILRLAAKVGEALVERTDIGPMLQTCAEVIAAHAGAERVTIWKADDRGTWLRVRGHAVSVGQPVAFDEVRSVGEDSMVGQVARHRRTFHQGRYLGLPLIVGDRLVGAIEIDAQGEFPELEVAGLVAVANQIAVGADRTRIVRDLQEANMRKNEFMATLAHELRGSLAPIRNSLALLVGKAATPEVRATAHQAMTRQLAHLVRLVDDLLDMNRISRGKLELRREPVVVQDVVREALDACAPAIESGGKSVEVELPDLAVVVDADRDRLIQVLCNLLTNASKYSDDGAHIGVSVKVVGDEVEVAVADSGIGIPADMLETVFEHFVQVEPLSERAQGGLGIGLSLVKNLVVMHGGRVSCSSDGLGKGSTFTLTLPVLEVRQLEPKPAARVGWVEPPPTTLEDETLRVLVVDDNRDSAETAALLLGQMGCAARAAHDGEEAMEVAEAYRPALILLDIGLPTMSGHDVARWMRKQAWGREVMLVAVTGWGQEEDVVESKQAGFDLHLVKPVDPSRLLELVEAVRQRSGDLGRLASSLR